MTNDSSCIFCKIAAGEIPSHVVWESDTHMAFLTLWPNTEGFTVLIPKKHYDSYVFDQEDAVIDGMMRACKSAAQKIDRAFEDVGRTGIIFEGFGVNHLHAKLVPLHGTKMDEWKKLSGTNRTFYPTYPGYIASHDSEKMDDGLLKDTCEKIKNA